MIGPKTRFVLPAMAMALMASSCAAPQRDIAGAEPRIALPGSPEAKAELALRLAAQARRDQDARAMLVAARMMLTSGTRPATLSDDGLEVEVGGDPVALAWANEAMIMADGDAIVTAEAEILKQMRPRGVLRSSLGTGPLRYVRRIEANDSVAFSIRTEPNSPARVAAIGDGDARIGLQVSADEAKVCDHGARTTHSLCSWRARGARHSVMLVNAGPLSSDVMLLSN